MGRDIIFELFQDVSEQGKLCFMCKFCEFKLRGSDRKRLTGHIVKNCKSVPEHERIRFQEKQQREAELEERKIQANGSTSSINGGGKSQGKRIRRDTSVGEVESAVDFSINHLLNRAQIDLFQQNISDLIVDLNLPFNVVDKPAFQKPFRQLVPDVVFPSKRALLDRSYQKAKARLEQDEELGPLDASTSATGIDNSNANIANRL